MKALALACLVAFPAFAQQADAPVAVVKKGELVPGDGLWLSDAQAVLQAKRVTACEAKAKSLEDDAGVRWWVPVLVGVVALSAGVATGYGIHAALSK